MTQNVYTPHKSNVGRKKEFPDRITLPLPDGVVGRLDAVIQGKETRLDVIRAAIEREIKRREKSEKNK